MEYTLEYDKLRKFLLMGNCDFVIKNNRNEHRINFLIKKDKEKDDIFYIKYKSHKWTYIGWFKKYHNQLRFKDEFNFYPKEGMITQDDNKYQIFKSFMEIIYIKEKLPNNVSVYYTGRCSKCGRTLTNPDYIKIGIGQWCLENT